MQRIIFFAAAMLISPGGFTQKKNATDSLKQVVLAARLHTGFIFAHNIYVQNTKGTHPFGFELEYSHLRSDSAAVSKFKCYPESGFSFTYVNFNKDFLGKSYSLNYFIQPCFRLSDRLKMSARAAAGFSYMTNPFDSVHNTQNHSYSGHINNLLQLGVGITYALGNHVALYAGGDFYHNSNGGFKEPNAGVNYINASVGIKYYTHSTVLPVYKKIIDTSWRHEPWHLELSLFYSPKRGYNMNYASSAKFVIGLSALAVKQLSSINAVTASAEIYYDDALKTKKQIFLKDSSSNTLAGILLGHRFLLNRFVFSQELGVYVYKNTKLYNKLYTNMYHTLYQRWGISYAVNKNWAVGINLLSHKQISDFIDGRIIYRLR